MSPQPTATATSRLAALCQSNSTQQRMQSRQPIQHAEFVRRLEAMPPDQVCAGGSICVRLRDGALRSCMLARVISGKPANLQPSEHSSHNLIQAGMNPQAEAYTARLPFPNSYCLTKWLAERLLAERHEPGFPVVIVRPAITGAVAGPPYPGCVH